MQKHKILITNYAHPDLMDGLEQFGYDVTYDLEIDNTQLLNEVDRYYGLIINSKIKADRVLFEKAKNLKFIARLGSGLETIDLEAARKLDIRVFNSPEGNRNAVAEHTLGMLFSLFNNIHSSDQEVRKGVWIREANRGTEVNDKTIGIVGYGNVGSTLVKRLSGFDSRILVYDKYVDKPINLRDGVEWVSLEELQRESDIISIHVQLTEETMFFMNQAFFDKCKTGVVIINTSRGKNLVLTDLLNALENGKVSYACLDVLENEKLETLNIYQKKSFDRLTKNKKIILTPHIAGWTHESLKRIAHTLLRKIDTHLKELKCPYGD